MPGLGGLPSLKLTEIHFQIVILCNIINTPLYHPTPNPIHRYTRDQEAEANEMIYFSNLRLYITTNAIFYAVMILFVALRKFG